jgi:putative nucleotidyltransferase with HDIG domain
LNGEVNDPRFAPLHPRPEILSAISTPMLVGNQLIGVLNLNVTRNYRRFSRGQLRALSILASTAAAGVKSALLFNEKERRVDQLLALRSIDQAIIGSLDLRLSLQVLLEHTIAQLQVDAADVLLLNPYTLRFEFAAGRGFFTKKMELSRLKLGEGLAGRAAFDRTIVSIPDLRVATDTFERAELLSAEAFITYYGIPLIAKGQVAGVLEVFHRTPLDPDQEWLAFFEALADQAAIAIDNAVLFDNLQRSSIELTLAYDATLEGWSRVLDLRDQETEGHTRRVTEMSMRLAAVMGMSELDLVQVRRGGLLHDIGKMAIPDRILHKPSALSEEEWAIMRKHPVHAYELLSTITYLRPALDIPLYHHERWDGSGYPHGLKAEQIPLTARIFAVVDVWDALRSDRPYRKGWEDGKVREYIQAEAGKQFDSQVVEAFLGLLNA